MAVITFRDSVVAMAPRWLRGTWAGRFLYVMGLHLDAMTDALTASIEMRFPGFYSEESLPLIGRERRIRRGFAESGPAYAGRLRKWLDDHRRHGNPYTLMRQLQGYLFPFAVRLRVVSNIGTWYTLGSDGSTSHRLSSPANWNWDGSAAEFSRYWVILYPPASLWVRDGTWGDGETWNGRPNETWGSTATPEQVAAVKAIVNEWNPPHAKCMGVIVCFDATIFDPTAAAGPPMPDGTWASFSKNVGGVQVPAREAKAIYWDM